MVKRVLPLFSVLAIALLFSAAVVAQNPTGSISGIVLDPQGAAIAGASIEIKDSATGTTVYTGTSNPDGHFEAANLPPGEYSITLSQQNFKKAVISNVRVDAGKTYDVSPRLELGAIVDTVSVEAGGAQVVETQNTSVQTVVSGKQITSLPFTSRSAILLGVLDPGAQTSGGSRNTTFEGLPKGTINITFDGINIQDNVLKSSDGFFAINDPRIDDVDEFNITSAGNSPDKSGEGAVQIGYVSKRGGNQWHGGVWEYFRNDYLNSNYFFSNLQGLHRQVIRLNEYGYKIGGPILKNKLFFFTDFDFFSLPQSTARQRLILIPGAGGPTQGFFTYKTTAAPSAATLANDSAWLTCNGTGTQCTANLFALASAKGFPASVDSVVSSYLNKVESAATAQGVTALTGTGCTVSSCNPLLSEQLNFNNVGNQLRKYPDIRVDYTISQHHTLELDYHYSHYISTPDTLNNVDATFPVAPFSSNIGTQISNRSLLVAAWRWAIGNSASNELRAGIQTAPVNFGIGVDQGGNTGLYPMINTNLGATQYRFNLTGVSSFFLSPGSYQGRNSALGQIHDAFSWTKGTHTLSFGADTSILHYNDFFLDTASMSFGIDTTNDPAATSMFTFGSGGNIPNIGSTDQGTAQGLYSSLTGRISGYSNSVCFNPSTRNFFTSNTGICQDRVNQTELGFYGTDSWRVKPNLTLNYGLRWEYTGIPADKLNEYYTLQQGIAGAYGVSGLNNLFQPGNVNGFVPTYVNDAGTQWYNKYYKALAPNVGFAWQPQFDNGLIKKITGGAGKTVIRGSYGITYSREGLNTFFNVAEVNPGANASQVMNSGNGNSQANGTFQAGSLNLASTNNLNFVLQSPGSFVPSFNVTPQSGNPVAIYDPNIRPPMVQSWTFGIQRELDANDVLEIRYVGNHGVGLWRRYSVNEVDTTANGFLQEFQSAANNLRINGGTSFGNTNPGGGTVALPIMTASFTGSTAGSQTNSNFSNSTLISDLNQGLVGTFAGTLDSLTNWSRLVASGNFPTNFWQVNPDARGGAVILGNTAQSTYNALQVDVRRRPYKGLQYDVNYTFSKSLTNYWANSSADAASFTSLLFPKWDKGPAPFDTRHAIKGQMIYELPFGEGKRWAFHNALANRFIGGWEINSITRWQTGQPILIQSGLGGTLNGNDPGVQLNGITANQLQSLLTTNKTEAPNSVYFVPASLLDSSLARANANVIQPCQNPGQLCQKVFVWGPQFFRADISLVKNTKITERVSLELRAEMLNAFNDADFYYACGSGTTPCSISTQSTSFGKIAGAYQDFSTTQDPGGRIVQLVGRVNF